MHLCIYVRRYVNKRSFRDTWSVSWCCFKSCWTFYEACMPIKASVHENARLPNHTESLFFMIQAQLERVVVPWTVPQGISGTLRIYIYI